MIAESSEGEGLQMSDKHKVTRKPGLLDRQFGHPSGILGSLVGMAMAVEHKELHRAVVEKLDLDSGDHVLEVGFGPGTAIRLAALRAAFVAGIEASSAMVLQAARRNRPTIRSGRVEVRRASVSAIPYPDKSFSAVFEINSFHHWDRPDVGLQEIFRVLMPGGRLLMALHQRRPESVQPELNRVAMLLSQTGFTSITCGEHRFAHGGAFVTARR